MDFQLLCGIPGSGKSTLTENLEGYPVSTDAIRKFLWGDESVLKHDTLVFKLAETIIDYLLAKNQDVIFDATNLTRKTRRKYIELAKNRGARVMLHWVDCPLEVAIKRNQQRERQVPVYAIKSLYKSLEPPSLEEGIAVINIYDQDLKLCQVKERGAT